MSAARGESGGAGTSSRGVVGLLPAAGLATRVAPLPGSKELFPVGFRRAPEGKLRPRVACHPVLEEMRAAGIARVFVVLRPGKWDIPAYLGDGSALGLGIAYLMMGAPHGAPYTIDQAYPFVGGSLVALGFPDIIFPPVAGYSRTLERQERTGADIVLGLFPAADPRQTDMVEVDAEGRVARLEIKPAASRLRQTWGLAVWTPEFTRFLHEHLERREPPAAGREAYVGEVVNEAIRAGMRVDGVPLADEPYLDIGTPENLAAAVRRFAAGEAW
jgi:glucose-1-phosphate thymidylyltransferase